MEELHVNYRAIVSSPWSASATAWWRASPLIELSNVKESPEQVAEILRRYAKDKVHTPR
jgi:hypothetical protein